MLEEIKHDFECGKKVTGRGYENLDDEQVEWILKELEKLQQENERYKEVLQYVYDECEKDLINCLYKIEKVLKAGNE